jgi:cell shape-determining protein MreC
MNDKLNNIDNVTGLKIKLIITFASIFAIAFIVISIVSYNISKSILIKNINAQTKEFVYSRAHEINNWTINLMATVHTFSKLINEIPEDRYITPKLLKIYENDDTFFNIYYASASGKIIRSKPWTPYAGYDPFSRPWYTTAINQEKTSISPVYIDVQSQELAFSISSPIFNEYKTLRGVVSADIQLKTLEERLDNIKLNGMGFAVLFDSSGVALAHSDKSLIGKNLFEDPKYKSFMTEVFDKKSGRIDYNIDFDKLFIFTKINSSEWIFGIVLIKDEIYSDLRTLTFKFLIIFIISLLVIILTSMYFTKRLTYFISILEKALDLHTAELKKKIAQVEYLSLTDPLTEIANRRKIEAALKSEIDRAQRTGHPLSVIMADIDHFKSYNDSYGHDTGDMVLKKFAEALNASIRITDLVGRIGGEEFLVICPETDAARAAILADKL